MKHLIFLLITTLTTISFAANELKYKPVINLSQYQGQTFFTLVKDIVKPALDQMAADGFVVADGKTAVAALKKVDKKVSAKALRAAGSVEKLQEVADLLSAGPAVTFYDLPAALGQAGIKAGRYDLTTYLALISGGGVGLEINPDNMAYHVNYGSGQKENDERTGRSFGEAPSRLALDASDKHYLEILENYVRGSGDNVHSFYKSLLEILLNNDTSTYASITPEGQAVATDFIAVYTAEQTRHLMSNLKNHPWDAALLEVTLLSALHAGQDEVTLIVNGEFTNTTLAQATGCTAASERKSKKASLIDYWQFSTNTDPEHCSRSGINITRRDFRKLGQMITAYQTENKPELMAKITRHFNTTKNADNVFAQLSDFLINYKTPAALDATTLELAEDFTNFLMQVRKDANKTSQFITDNVQTSKR